MAGDERTRETRTGETEQERLNRNMNELLQELRVSQTGVQILFAFLLALPFAQRFTEVTSFQRDVYFATLLLAGAAAGAPWRRSRPAWPSCCSSCSGTCCR